MVHKRNFEEIVGGIILIMVAISVFSIILADLNFSSFLNKYFFIFLIMSMSVALVFQIIEVFKKLR